VTALRVRVPLAPHGVGFGAKRPARQLPCREAAMASHRRLLAEAGRLFLGDACNNDVLGPKAPRLDKIAHRPQRASLKEF
jgi:hypothetical protein